MESGPALDDLTARVVRLVIALPTGGKRRIVAIAGAPGSGKSTLAGAVAQALLASGSQAQVLPMDGFHLDNAYLDARGLRARKGAPETFDLGGFRSLVARLSVEDEVFAPSFDRSRDIVVGSSIYIGPEVETVLVEGNYLLLDAPGWRDLPRYWDASVMLRVPRETLEHRLVARWLAEGFAPDEARAKALGNDLPNAELVQGSTLPADLVL